MLWIQFGNLAQRRGCPPFWQLAAHFSPPRFVFMRFYPAYVNTAVCNVGRAGVQRAQFADGSDGRVSGDTLRDKRTVFEKRDWNFDLKLRATKGGAVENNREERRGRCRRRER